MTKSIKGTLAAAATAGACGSTWVYATTLTAMTVTLTLDATGATTI
jgi:hypothetical protein